MPLIHTLSLACDEKAARLLRAAFSPIMETLQIEKPTRDKFLLTLSEVTTNLAKYPVPRPDTVRVELWRTRAHWRLKICDDGPPFHEMTQKTDPRLPDDTEMAESGRGLYILHQQFPDFSYVPNTNGDTKWNTLVLNTLLNPDVRQMPTAVVVDDDPVFLKVIEQYLKDVFSVTGFSDVESALNYLDINSADLVISDISMPGTDGYTFRRNLQKRGKTNTVPFIYLTGSTSDKNRDTAAELSIDGYLTKPVQKQALVSTIRRIMKRASDLRTSIGDRLDTEITEALRPGFSRTPIGYAVATAHEAASAGGGDLLIEHETEEGHLVVLADIMGHGEQAKFFAHAFSGYAYGAIRALGRGTSPATLLCELSTMFLEDRLLKHSFATAVALLLKPDGTVKVASAGHPPPFLMNGNTLTDIDVGGPLLGLMDNPGYSEVQFTMTTDQRLVLYTDGISEAERTIISDPEELLLQSPDEQTVATDQEIATGLLQHAQARSNYILADDATSVVLRKIDECD